MNLKRFKYQSIKYQLKLLKIAILESLSLIELQQKKVILN